MHVRSRTERPLLFLGDIVFFYLALGITLVLRSFELPSWYYLELHLPPFTFLFACWILLFFIAGLYDQHTTLFRRTLPERIVRVQIVNVILAALFFFFVPFFGIAPKTNLLLYLVISSALIIFWRLDLFPRLLRRRAAAALLVGGGKEYKELLDEVNQNSRYPFRFSHEINVDKLQPGALSERLFAELRNHELGYVVIDMAHPKLAQILPHLYKPLFSNVRFINARDFYEDIFERLPLSILSDLSAIEALALRPSSHWQGTIKRTLDIIGALLMGVVTVLITPLVWLALRIESKGPLFIAQDRIGQGGKSMRVFKFRSMHFHDPKGVWAGEDSNTVTRVGSFLRRTSLDEFPQFLNVLKGELSLIGPRNDIEGLAKRLADAVPSYMVRYAVKPGITGWAQINQQYEQGNISPQSIEETKVRLMYDFYYLEHHSLMLDLIIALKTIKRMFFRVSAW